MERSSPSPPCFGKAMYESLIRGEVASDDEQRRQAVSYHRGSCEDFLERHKNDVSRALRDRLPGVKAIAPWLFPRIADARTLRLAWDFLAAKGGQTPGPNGHRYKEYNSAEIWEWCRCVAHALRTATYHSGPERVSWINKASGVGQRPIVLLNIEDRVVQRAIVLILQPLLDPLFDPRSLGYRPKLGHLHALAVAEQLTTAQRRMVWLAEDIEDAFLHVPLSRLLQVVGKLLPDNDLLGLLERVLPAQQPGQTHLNINKKSEQRCANLIVPGRLEPFLLDPPHDRFVALEQGQHPTA